MPTVEISEHVKQELNQIKTDEQHKSYDSVLRSLIGNYQG